MSFNQLTGTGVAIVSPFHENGQLDFESLQNLIEHLLKGGIDYIVALGTTGESVTLSAAEQDQFIDACIEYIDGRIPLVVGYGGNDTQALLDRIKQRNFASIAAIMSSSPAYSKPSQAGLVAHFTAVADIAPVPVILYNVPGRTSKNMTAATTIKLAGHNNVIAIKEASADVIQAMEIIKNCPEDFAVVSGDDLLGVPMIASGMSGVISVIANAFPAIYAAIVKASLNNDYQKARKLHFELMGITTLIYEENNPAGIKYVLNKLGICRNVLRLPLVPVSEDLARKIDQEIVKLIAFSK